MEKLSLRQVIEAGRRKGGIQWQEDAEIQAEYGQLRGTKNSGKRGSAEE